MTDGGGLTKAALIEEVAHVAGLSKKRAEIPVARNVWQHLDGGNPAVAARRLIMARTARRVNGRPVRLSPGGSTLWNQRHPFGSGRRCPGFDRHQVRPTPARPTMPER